jgi:integrase/recombinase XerD
MGRRCQTQLPERDIDPLIRLLGRLPPDSLNALVSLARQISEGNGHRPEHMEGLRISTPAEGIPFWVAKMKSERYSEGTIKMYRYHAERRLRENPRPTKLGIQSYLAGRLDAGISPTMVENERKALRSLFSFLHEEGLWHEDPTAGIRHVRVAYGNRRCPSQADVERVLNEGCYRARDTDKIRAIIILLATTGLRLTEAASLRKECIDFGPLELRILGKGGKHRIVPLLPMTAETLRGYMERRANNSPFVFPGKGRTGYAEIYNIEKTLKRACLRAGVEPFTPHQLRHLYATEMLRRGAKLEVVGRILGHSSIGITADVYRHIRTGEMHEEHLRFAPFNGRKASAEGQL